MEDIGKNLERIIREIDNELIYLEKEELLVIKDYVSKKKSPDKILDQIINLDLSSLLNPMAIAKILGYENFENFDEVGVYTKRYRLLNKVPKMPSNIVENLVKSFKSFQHILIADIPALDEVDGIGEIRARTIKRSLQRMQEQFVFDKLLS